MNVGTSGEIKYHLTLNKEEALFLKNIVQNPLFVADPADEDFKQKNIRRTFWDALPSLQELQS